MLICVCECIGWLCTYICDLFIVCVSVWGEGWCVCDYVLCICIRFVLMYCFFCIVDMSCAMDYVYDCYHLYWFAMFIYISWFVDVFCYTYIYIYKCFVGPQYIYIYILYILFCSYVFLCCHDGLFFKYIVW